MQARGACLADGNSLRSTVTHRAENTGPPASPRLPGESAAKLSGQPCARPGRLHVTGICKTVSSTGGGHHPAR